MDDGKPIAGTPSETEPPYVTVTMSRFHAYWFHRAARRFYREQKTAAYADLELMGAIDHFAFARALAVVVRQLEHDVPGLDRASISPSLEPSTDLILENDNDRPPIPG